MDHLLTSESTNTTTMISVRIVKAVCFVLVGLVFCLAIAVSISWMCLLLQCAGLLFKLLLQRAGSVLWHDIPQFIKARRANCIDGSELAQ